MDRINRMVPPQADQNKEVKSNVCTYKCAYHRDTEWRLPGDMSGLTSDSGLANYSRCADLEFHPVYGPEIELRKRGLNDPPAKSVFAGNNDFWGNLRDDHL